MKKYILILSVFLTFLSTAQTRIKVMHYNLLDFDTPTPATRENYLKEILDSIQPDLFMVCELSSSADADVILNTSLHTSDNRYASATFVTNTSGYPDLQQLAFYNTQKLELTAQSVIKTYVRDINHYTFKLKTTNSATNPIYLDAFEAHLKASTGSSNENARKDMVTAFTTALASVPTSHYVVIGGDFNLYKDTEPAYQELLDPTNAIVLVDPVNRPGTWHSNSSFADVHTQSTHSGSFYFDGTNYYGAGGDLDDRFDFILMSQSLNLSRDFYYVPNSYKAFGNNGNCYNKAIDDPSCIGHFSQTIRNTLYHMSDHLPVVMELETPENTLDVASESLQTPLIFSRGNVVKDWLELKFNANFAGKSLSIFNQLGQKVFTTVIKTSQMQKFNVSHLETGIYYIKIENTKMLNPLKFVKLP